MTEKKKIKNIHMRLFLNTLKLSAFTFGGGYVIISLMRKRCVEQLGWLDEEEMLDLTALAQSSPGAVAVNASILLGYRLAGITGALVTVLGTILPPLVILFIISFFYRDFRDNAYVGYALKGMQAGVAAVICDVVVSMAAKIIGRKRLLYDVMMLAVFARCFLWA
jgi:chromate transporter